MLEIAGKHVPETLGELLEPERTALLVIDMQNESCSAGGLFHQLGADLSLYPRAIEEIARVMQVARSAGVLVIHTQHTVLENQMSESPSHLRFVWHLTREKYGRSSNDVMLDKSWGHEIISALAPDDDGIVIRKHRSSAFAGTTLDLVLRSNDIDRLIITGCVTEGCIESTARDAESRDFYVVVCRDAVATDVKKHHEASLYNMSIRFLVPTAAEICRVWETSSVNDEHEEVASR